MLRVSHLKNHWRGIGAITFGACFLLFTGFAISPAGAGNTAAITVHDNGTKEVVTTDATTVAEVLERANIELGEKDIVEPALDAEITSTTFNVNVYRARPVIIMDDDGEEYRVMSAHESPRLVAEKVEDIEVYEEDEFESELITDFLDTDHVGYRVHVHRAIAVSVDIGGKESEIRTQAETVGGLLEELEVELGEDDVLKPGADTPIVEGMEVTLTQIGVETVTEEEEIEPEVEQIRDNDRPIGYQKVEEPGSPGLALVTYEVEYENGEEVNREEIRRVVEQEAKPRVVVVGNKANYAGGPLNEEQLNALGSCESGMNPSTNTGNGFYGAFQFMPSTWQAVHGGPYSMPHEAPLSAQKEAVQTLLSSSSIHTQFPGCARQMQAQGIL